MFTSRIILAVLSITVFSAFCAAMAGGGPALGKWEFTGKDNTGLVWTGTLSIGKLDPNRFDANKYYAICSVEVESTDPSKGTRGVEAPCKYDPGARAVSFSTGGSTLHSYTAVLSRDGKSLTQGKWTETKNDPRKGGQSGLGVVRSGNWSAKLKP